jgi:hypothetical protein
MSEGCCLHEFRGREGVLSLQLIIMDRWDINLLSASAFPNDSQG